MTSAWSPLRAHWTPQHSVHDPEPEFLTKSRKKPLPTIKKNMLSGDQLDSIFHAMAEVERLCESPIERLFGTAAAVVIGATGLRFLPQFGLSNYRYDFAVLHPRLDQVLMLIECDGKEFHSTLAQIANDRRKDTAAEEINAFVARYTGSEINRDARYCAENALGRLCKAWRVVR